MVGGGRGGSGQGEGEKTGKSRGQWRVASGEGAGMNGVVG